MIMVLISLILHHFKRDSYIVRRMSGLILSVEGRCADCGYPPSLARSQKMRAAFRGLHRKNFMRYKRKSRSHVRSAFFFLSGRFIIGRFTGEKLAVRKIKVYLERQKSVEFEKLDSCSVSFCNRMLFGNVVFLY